MCLTETWGEIHPNEDCSILNCFKDCEDIRRCPGCGGVALLHHPLTNFKLQLTRSDFSFQFIFRVLWNKPMMGFYISPKATIQELQSFLAEAQVLLRGPGILLGDFKARAVQ